MTYSDYQQKRLKFNEEEYELNKEIAYDFMHEREIEK
jgi:hypothetical protein